MAPEVAADRQEPLEIVRLRHWGRWVSAVVILALLVAAFVVLSQARIKWRRCRLRDLSRDARRVAEHRAARRHRADGGHRDRDRHRPDAPQRQSRREMVCDGLHLAVPRSARAAADPHLVQLGAGHSDHRHSAAFGGGYLLNEPTNVLVSAFTAALLGLALNESAYMAEIVRAGLNSVDGGQTEAAKSIGMSPSLTLRRVVLPQAMR